MTSLATNERIATKEIKVGLAVIAVLVLALAWVVARRFLRTVDVPDAAIESSPSQEVDPGQPSPQADRQPMILPPSDRYLGPAAYVKPHNLTPIQTPDSALARPFDHRPSLLPALPEENQSPRAAALPKVEPLAPAASGRGPIRNAPIGEETEERGHPQTQADDLSSQPPQADRRSAVEDDLSSQPSEPYERSAPREQTTTRPALATVIPTAAALPPKQDHGFSDDTAVRPSQPPPFASGLPEILPINDADVRPGRKYFVEEGDTLSVIARFELGDSDRWTELLLLNRDRRTSWRDPLQPGTWLTLPADRDESP